MQELWAIIFKPWKDEPVYHAFAKDLLRPYEFHLAYMTRCGRRIGDGTPMLPMKHVRKFGRPCRSCYPS